MADDKIATIDLELCAVPEQLAAGSEEEAQQQQIQIEDVDSRITEGGSTEGLS